MADYALDLVVERLRRSGEPPEWKGKLRPTFVSQPNNPAAQSENLQRYMTGYPWIVIAEDRGGYLCYFCAICRKVATIFHILPDAHVNKTCHNFAGQLGYSMPRWMARFRGVDTRQGSLFNEYGDNIWPPLCGSCYARPLEANATRCGLCLPSTGQQPADEGGRHDDVRMADSSKRTRFSDTYLDAEFVRTDKPKLVSRNECRDTREMDKARASGSDGRRSEPPPIDDRQVPPRWRQPIGAVRTPVQP